MSMPTIDSRVYSLNLPVCARSSPLFWNINSRFHSLLPSQTYDLGLRLRLTTIHELVNASVRIVEKRLEEERVYRGKKSNAVEFSL